jgi:hypothetical protein
MCSKNTLKNGTLEIGFSTTTMLLLLLFCLCRNFCPEIMTVDLNPPYSSQLASCNYFLSLQEKNAD